MVYILGYLVWEVGYSYGYIYIELWLYLGILNSFIFFRVCWIMGKILFIIFLIIVRRLEINEK